MTPFATPPLSVRRASGFVLTGFSDGYSTSRTVPEVLSGGDHLKISRWRRERALEKTARNRPDLLETAELSDRDRDFLRSLQRSES